MGVIYKECLIMIVKPVKGRLVKRPETMTEITEPVEVPDNDPFYLRRIADGDLTTEKEDKSHEQKDYKEPEKTPEAKKKGAE